MVAGKGVKPAGAPKTSSQAQFDFSRFAVVRDMIAQKHGDNTPVNRALIVQVGCFLGAVCIYSTTQV